MNRRIGVQLCLYFELDAKINYKIRYLETSEQKVS